MNYPEGQPNPVLDRKKILQSCKILNSHTVKDATFFSKCSFSVLKKRIIIKRLVFCFFFNARFSQPIPKPCLNIAAISFLASRKMSEVNTVCFSIPLTVNWLAWCPRRQIDIWGFLVACDYGNLVLSANLTTRTILFINNEPISLNSAVFTCYCSSKAYYQHPCFGNHNYPKT